MGSDYGIRQDCCGGGGSPLSDLYLVDLHQDSRRAIVLVGGERHHLGIIGDDDMGQCVEDRSDEFIQVGPLRWVYPFLLRSRLRSREAESKSDRDGTFDRFPHPSLGLSRHKLPPLVQSLRCGGYHRPILDDEGPRRTLRDGETRDIEPYRPLDPEKELGSGLLFLRVLSVLAFHLVLMRGCFLGGGNSASFHINSIAKPKAAFVAILCPNTASV